MENKIEFRLDNGQIECIDDTMAEVYKQKSPAERIKIASDMRQSARRLLNDSIRAFHPEWPEEKIQKEITGRLSHEAV